MHENQKDRTRIVYSDVTAALQGQEVRELWHRLKSELTREGGGPDACAAYLDSELTRLGEQVRRALNSAGQGPRG